MKHVGTPPPRAAAPPPGWLHAGNNPEFICDLSKIKHPKDGIEMGVGQSLAQSLSPSAEESHACDLVQGEMSSPVTRCR